MKARVRTRNRTEPDQVERWMVRVSKQDYDQVKAGLNHGQPTLLGRLFLRSLAKMIKDDRTDEILRFLLAKDELKLPPVKLDNLYE